MLAENDLFKEDKVYNEQVDEAVLYEKINEVQKFLGFKMVDSCDNCHYHSEGKCHIMKKYDSQLEFDVTMLNKCKHYKRGV